MLTTWPPNIAKMCRGTLLTDDDWRSWLEELRVSPADHKRTRILYGAGCSVLQ